MSRRPEEPKSKSAVLDLAQARGARRIKQYEAKIRTLLENNRRSLNRLFVTNLVYTRQGTRAGRELLLVHQELLRVVELLRRIEAGDAAPGRAVSTDALFSELDSRLERACAITSRTGEILGVQKRDP